LHKNKSPPRLRDELQNSGKFYEIINY